MSCEIKNEKNLIAHVNIPKNKIKVFCFHLVLFLRPYLTVEKSLPDKWVRGLRFVVIYFRYQRPVCRPVNILLQTDVFMLTMHTEHFVP